ncbi:MAG: preprotein translocase subunit SecG [Acidobacteriota bacterium]
MFTLLVIFHVLFGVFLIAVVLLQTGKAGSIADVFGGGGSMAAFGARGAATVLTRVTTIAAALFMVTSLALSVVKSSERSLMENAPPAPAKQEAPAQPKK